MSDSGVLPTPIRIYIHVCAISHWREVCGVLFEALQRSGLLSCAASVKVGLIGGDESTVMYPESAAQYVAFRSTDSSLSEKATLNHLLFPDAVGATDQPFYALYLHSKGVKHGPHAHSVTDWTRFMTYFLVYRFPVCLEALHQGANVVGVDLQGARGPSAPHITTHFSGNFWWTRSDHVASLGPCEDPHPLAPEMWVCRPEGRRYHCLHQSGVNHYIDRCLPETYETPPIVTPALVAARALSDLRWAALTSLVTRALREPEKALLTFIPRAWKEVIDAGALRGIVGIPNLHIYLERS